MAKQTRKNLIQYSIMPGDDLWIWKYFSNHKNGSNSKIKTHHKAWFIHWPHALVRRPPACARRRARAQHFIFAPSIYSSAYNNDRAHMWRCTKILGFAVWGTHNILSSSQANTLHWLKPLNVGAGTLACGRGKVWTGLKLLCLVPIEEWFVDLHFE